MNAVSRSRWLQTCAWLVFGIGVFNAVIVSGAQYLQPMFYKDVFAEEFDGLDEKEAASTRVIQYMERTAINRAAIPLTTGVSLIVLSVVIILNTRTSTLSND